MTLKIVAAIIIGASLGALLRYGLSVKLNPILAFIPLGTLIVNWLGSFLIGVMVCVAMHYSGIPKELMIGTITGFLGSLTTFSTFSVETYDLIVRKEYFIGAMQVILHVVGSIAMVFLGIVLCKFFFSVFKMK